MTSKRRRGCLPRLLLFAAPAVAAVLLLSAVLLAALRFVDPPTTTVQMQRHVEALLHGAEYRKRYSFVPLNRISADLQHAVIAAEDGRFYEHHGIDWKQVQVVMEESRETGEVSRGASTITQQLVKNLFFTTHRNPLRKGAEYVLAPMADVILGKRRVLELYLNVVEWGDGVFGAESAARVYYGVPAARVGREQGARLAACLPAPRRRKPARMDRYSGQILTRMRQMGW